MMRKRGMADPLAAHSTQWGFRHYHRTEPYQVPFACRVGTLAHLYARARSAVAEAAQLH